MLKVSSAILFVLLYFPHVNPLQNLEADDLGIWTSFKKVHSKQYESTEEENVRKQIFFQSLQFVRTHNERYVKGLETFDVEINKFADLTDDEFRTKMLGFTHYSEDIQTSQMFLRNTDTHDLPAEVDWRSQGAVTEVKTQGECGSDWAFSATGSLEGQHFLKTKRLVSLSEQNLIDCSLAEGNIGCLGGNMVQAFQYVVNNTGLDTEKAYPYIADMHKCTFDSASVGARASGYVVIPKGSEEDLQAAVAQVGPVSVAVYGSKISFRLYKSGIYKVRFCPRWLLDHGMLAVGYGTLNSTLGYNKRTSEKYWLVKNSWGTDWGMQGYVMMARDYKNMCGIANEASYPTV